MSSQDIKRLNSRDPSERKAAIRAVAKAKDINALKQLAKMAKDDPVKDIQVLAAQAVAYIRKQHGESSASDKAIDKKHKQPAKVQVPEKNVKKAQHAISRAQSFLMNHQHSEVARHLEQALKLNPNLRQDAYLLSMAETVTGKIGEEAVDMLSNRSEFKKLARKESDALRSKDDQKHEEVVSKIGWQDVLFDTGLLLGIMLISAFVAFFITVQSAQNYDNKYQQNIADINNAMGRGWCPDQLKGADGLIVCYKSDPNAGPTGTEVLTFKQMSFDPDFYKIVTDWKTAKIGDYIVPILAIGFGVPFATLMIALIIHIVAKALLRAIGSYPHTVHHVTMAILSRAVLLLVAGVAGIIIGFSMGGGVVVQVFMGIIGVIGLLTLFGVINAVSKAYNIGMGSALLPALIGLSPAIAAGVFAVMQAGLLEF